MIVTINGTILVAGEERYHLRVGWESVEAHMVGFRESDGLQAWRALASPFFTASLAWSMLPS